MAIRLTYLLTLTALVVGCTEAPQDEPEPTRIEAIITPQGGRMASPDGRMVLEFGPGAVTEDTLIWAEPMATTTLGPQWAEARRVLAPYRFGPAGQTFNVTGTLTFIVDSDDLLHDEQHADPTDPTAARYGWRIAGSSDGGELELAEGIVQSGADTTTIRGGLTHFSEYAVIPAFTERLITTCTECSVGQRGAAFLEITNNRQRPITQVRGSFSSSGPIVLSGETTRAAEARGETPTPNTERYGPASISGGETIYTAADFFCSDVGSGSVQSTGAANITAPINCIAGEGNSHGGRATTYGTLSPLPTVRVVPSCQNNCVVGNDYFATVFLTNGHPTGLGAISGSVRGGTPVSVDDENISLSTFASGAVSTTSVSFRCDETGAGMISVSLSRTSGASFGALEPITCVDSAGSSTPVLDGSLKEHLLHNCGEAGCQVGRTYNGVAWAKSSLEAADYVLVNAAPSGGLQLVYNEEWLEYLGYYPEVVSLNAELAPDGYAAVPFSFRCTKPGNASFAVSMFAKVSGINTERNVDVLCVAAD